MNMPLSEAIRNCKMSLTNLKGITRRSWETVLEAAEKVLASECIRHVGIECPHYSDGACLNGRIKIPCRFHISTERIKCDLLSKGKTQKEN